MANRQQVLAQFLHYYIPVGTWDAHARRSSNDDGTWLFLLPSLQDMPPALSSTILALCTAYIGRLNADEALVQQSLSFHGRALWALQKALWDPSSMYKDETLAACMALAMYEATECPGKNNKAYASHMDGCTRLIRQRAAEAHTSALGHGLFVSFRISGVSQRNP